MKIQNVDINRLNPAAYNPRVELQDGDPEFEKLKTNLKKYGFVQPIVVNKRTGNMVAGHQRRKAAISIGMDEVPVTYVDVSENEEKKLNLALNKISGSWDEEALGELLAELQDEGEDLSDTGFDEIEIEELTMAFADVDIDSSFMGDDAPFDSEEDEEEEVFDDDEFGADERGYVIKYELIFEDEVQKETFYEFMKQLKELYDPEAFPTHASRIHAYLVKEGLKGIKGLLERKNAQKG
ncbi:ParB-like nuclease domain protein [Bacillus phage 031MP004]|nr:ParB-like nuclease domain protein [Bacillus phage 031MP004]